MLYFTVFWERACFFQTKFIGLTSWEVGGKQNKSKQMNVMLWSKVIQYPITHLVYYTVSAFVLMFANKAKL